MSNKDKLIQLDMQDFAPVICEILKSGSSIRLTVTGNSMRPMLKDRVDSVVIAPADRTVKRWELPLYQRDDGRLVLHRVIKRKKGIYTMCGDNQIVLESPVYPEQIVGVAVEFTHKGKTVSCKNRLYRTYAALWSILWPIRPIIVRLYTKIIKRR